MTDHSMSELLGRLHQEENPWVSLNSVRFIIWCTYILAFVIVLGIVMLLVYPPLGF